MREPADYTLYFEAVARNPPRGPGAWGCVLVDADGLAVLEDGAVVRAGRPVTRAEMELAALMAGLRMASLLRLPIRTLTVQCPSADLLVQVTDLEGARDGTWRQAAEARRLARRVRCAKLRFVRLMADRSPATGLAGQAFADAEAGTPVRRLVATDAGGHARPW